MASSQSTVRASSSATELYNPKTVFTHAASLHQGFPHCAIFPTAASRRSLGRVSVPMWPVNLSVRLPIAGLVSRYLTNYLIGREPIFYRISPLIPTRCQLGMLCGISVGFPTLSPCKRQVAHVLLTRPPLDLRPTPKFLLLFLLLLLRFHCAGFRLSVSHACTPAYPAPK